MASCPGAGDSTLNQSSRQVIVTEPKDKGGSRMEKSVIERESSHNLPSKGGVGSCARYALMRAQGRGSHPEIAQPALPPLAQSTKLGYGRGVAAQANGLFLTSSISVMRRAKGLRDGGRNAEKSVQLGQVRS